MSKVICDVCGTSYAETASQCPICGCAKPANAGEAASAAEYTYVKGGRFSKSNVRKRSKEVDLVRQTKKPRPAPAGAAKQTPVQTNEPEQSNRGLIITLVLLLIAIAIVLVYIITTFFGAPAAPAPTEPTGDNSTTLPNVTDGPVDVPCTDLTVSVAQLELIVGMADRLTVSALPENTTDTITYTSSNPEVANVSNQGHVVAVSAGEATITITCGQVTKTCKVICENDEPDPPVVPNDDWTLRTDDISMFSAGEKYTLFKGTVDLNLVTFRSDNEAIATFKNGVLTAVSAGTTKVHAEYNGKTMTCIVRCKIKAVDPNDAVISPSDDVSIKVGESFTLSLKSPQGDPITVTWSASKDGICTIEGNKITGTAVGTVTVSAVHEGKTYSCIVRVKKAG